MDKITRETRQLSFEDINKNKRKRYEQILDILQGKEMTAKEVAVEMFNRNFTDSTDRNYSQPRLYELVNMDYVEIVGKRVCEYTNKKVSVYRLKKNSNKDLEVERRTKDV